MGSNDTSNQNQMAASSKHSPQTVGKELMNANKQKKLIIFKKNFQNSKKKQIASKLFEILKQNSTDTFSTKLN